MMQHCRSTLRYRVTGDVMTTLPNTTPEMEKLTDTTGVSGTSAKCSERSNKSKTRTIGLFHANADWRQFLNNLIAPVQSPCRMDLKRRRVLLAPFAKVTISDQGSKVLMAAAPSSSWSRYTPLRYTAHAGALNVLSAAA